MLPSASDASSSFDLLHERVRRWIWDQQWSELRDVQENAIRAILGGEDDAIITAATAAGKTEAAFLPICSTLVDDDAQPGVQTLYVGPLKALINDQWRRLDGLCESLDIPVHRWHGDVTATARQKLIRNPDGILLITPESLEALFVRRGTDVARIFAGLRFIVIDELHAFIGSERGMQLQSLLHRIERVLHRRVRRIGLSATLGDMNIAADFLRPPNRRTAACTIVSSSEAGSGVKLRLYGFKRSLREGTSAENEEADDCAQSIAQHLFRTLRGSNNLVFANARSKVELYTDLLSRMCAAANLPQEFFAHHGSLSRELRFHVEDQLKRGDRPMTVICTSTLEMGIDLGAVTSVAQVGCPPNVAALRQRLGRSGRRGEPAVLRLYIEEETVTDRSAPQDAIRAELVETIAMVNLLLAKWVEPPLGGMVHGSTLVQQLLSLIAQYGGVTAADAYALLCESGPFEHVPRPMFVALLRNLASLDLITQMNDGLLIHGVKGEKFVNSHDFYTAFITPDEYRLVTGGTALGTLPIVNPIAAGSFLIFAGRRWRVVGVDDERKVIDLAPAAGGKVPVFDSSARGAVHDRVRAEMRAIYMAEDIPAYVDKQAGDLLHEGRENFRRYGLDRTSFIHCADGAIYFPWYGSLGMNTLVQQLAARDVRVSIEGPAIVGDRITPDALRDAVTACEAESPIDTIALAALVQNKHEEKWDWALDEATLCASYASRKLRRV
ncbi:MAG TPA: DEAD/DEAH box helicase [Thermoanaerobaculia bacterium]|nr:DEAD/DEAH box helicase [Thermoanaerobaculia bacterium]